MLHVQPLLMLLLVRADTAAAAAAAAAECSISNITVVSLAELDPAASPKTTQRTHLPRVRPPLFVRC
jgi:hypothetical protein